MRTAPPWLRFGRTSTGVAVRAPIGKGVLLSAAAVWNAVIAGFVGPSNALFLLVGALAFLVFGYFATRAFWNTTRVDFVDGELVLRSGPLPPTARLSHPISDIRAISILSPAVDRDDGYKVWLVTQSGAQVELPLGLDSIIIRNNTSRTVYYGRASQEEVSFVVDALVEALEEARRTGAHYRIAGGGPRLASDEGDDEARRDDANEEQARRGA
jgi:hypothetical protein